MNNCPLVPKLSSVYNFIGTVLYHIRLKTSFSFLFYHSRITPAEKKALNCIWFPFFLFLMSLFFCSRGICPSWGMHRFSMQPVAEAALVGPAVVAAGSDAFWKPRSKYKITNGQLSRFGGGDGCGGTRANEWHIRRSRCIYGV